MNLLTIYREGNNTLMRDEATGETALLDNQEQAISNFASWIYTGHLSGKPTEKKESKLKDWAQIEIMMSNEP